MRELEKIYYDYQNQSGTDGEAVVKARDTVFDYLESKDLQIEEYEDFICDYACENEKQGFLSGFQYAMKIALECMAAKTA